MGLLNFLFGKKAKTQPMTPAKPEATIPPPQRHSPVNKDDGPHLPRSETENLRRWRESGQPGSWVEAHKGQWTHQDWLGLLETLRHSPYWPMQPDEVGQVLEDLKSRTGELR